MFDRLKTLMHRLTDHTVLSDLLDPVSRALARVRQAAVGRTLTMPDFIALGVLRHRQGMSTLREQVQTLRHLDPVVAARGPLARSTWSDALAAPSRQAVLAAVVPALVQEARQVLPDRLAGIPDLGGRPVRAIDGTDQAESAPCRRRTPQQGGEDHPKGHALLSFYNLRRGVPEDVRVDTRRRHETRILRDYDQEPQALTRERRGLWLVDRACIDAAFWDAKQRALPITMITRMKSNLCVDATAGLPIADDPANAGVIQDLRVTLSSAREEWRLITYRPRRGGELPFLTHDFSLLPGVVAFLYFRRWEEEKCFDTWKNDFAQAKAWGKGTVAIANQARLAIITSLLVAILLHTRLGAAGAQDEKAWAKQEKRQKAKREDPEGTDRPDWSVPLFRYTAKVSRQVLRFFKHCFLKPASPGLYERELGPMLKAYL
ncbi:MAG: hypothetical protein WAT36_05780 [Chromatiaceae bacterium]